MLVPLSWLKDYVEIDLLPEEIAARLTAAGLEIGGLRYIGVPQNQVPGLRQPPSDHLVWDREKIVLGAIREVKSHPNADKLVLALVDHGGPDLEQCVTGAPNLFPCKDQGPLAQPLWTAFAREGAEVWDGHSDTPRRMILKSKALRGIDNKSMVCSEKELGISEEHEGVILLEHAAGYVAGTPLQDVLGDVVFTVELTPNLGHNFSIVGVARELAALTGKTLREPDFNVLAAGPAIAGQVEIEIRVPELNPRFTLTLLKGTQVKPSPFWMQYRLRLAGQRPINNIVDVTNYVTFEMGQPLHAFDYDKLVARAGGKTPRLITRLPQPGETLTTLDGVTRPLAERQILVCDTAGVLSLGGIIGGADTEISDSTTNVLLEAAAWNFINIRKTAQAQKVFTEAGTRFSRNIHPSRALFGNQRGIELMRRLGGGQIAAGLIDKYASHAPTIHLDLPVGEVKRLLGLELSVQEVADILTRLQFEVTLRGDVLHVTAPDYRTDISPGEVGQADLVEEIARIYGYDNIPSTIIADAMPPQRADHVFETEERIRDWLVALGLRENISYRMTSPEAEALLTPPGLASSLPAGEYVVLANPIVPERSVMRHSLLGGLLATAAQNARYHTRQQVFEIGSIYLKRYEILPLEPLRLGIVVTGRRRPAGWMQDEPGDTLNFFDLKGLIEGLVSRLHLPAVTYARSSHTTFHPGRSATLLIDGVPAGDFGELHPLVAAAFKIGGGPVLAAELDLSAMIAAAPLRFDVSPLPLTPAVLEDIALVVAEATPAAQVEAVIRKAGGSLLKSVTLFDVYRGDSIPAGHKSLAYALAYQTDEKTLEDKDVEKLRKKIIALAERELNAKLRA
jgi:phenylalanyl-tRNA synthetase beta chain